MKWPIPSTINRNAENATILEHEYARQMRLLQLYWQLHSAQVRHDTSIAQRSAGSEMYLHPTSVDVVGGKSSIHQHRVSLGPAKSAALLLLTADGET